MEDIYCSKCDKVTPHITIDDPDPFKSRGDYFSCYICGADEKRVYRNGKKLEKPIFLDRSRTKEGKLATKAQSSAQKTQ